MPDLFTYLEYRDYLKDAYEERRKLQPYFSYRFIGNKVGMDSSYLTRLFQKKLHLGDDLVERMAAGVVEHGRVRVGEVGLDPDRGLAFLKAVVEHLLPELEIFCHGKVTAGAGNLILLEFLELLVVAGADIRPATLDQLFAEIIVNRETIALGDDLGDPEAEPFYVFLDGRVGFGINTLRIGIFDPEDKGAAGMPGIQPVKQSSAGPANMQEPRRTRRKAHAWFHRPSLTQNRPLGNPCRAQARRASKT